MPSRAAAATPRQSPPRRAARGTSFAGGGGGRVQVRGVRAKGVGRAWAVRTHDGQQSGLHRGSRAGCRAGSRAGSRWAADWVADGAAGRAQGLRPAEAKLQLEEVCEEAVPEDAEDAEEEDRAHQQPHEEAEVVLRTHHLVEKSCHKPHVTPPHANSRWQLTGTLLACRWPAARAGASRENLKAPHLTPRAQSILFATRSTPACADSPAAAVGRSHYSCRPLESRQNGDGAAAYPVTAATAALPGGGRQC
jgi:hypothetical protein